MKQIQRTDADPKIDCLITIAKINKSIPTLSDHLFRLKWECSQQQEIMAISFLFIPPLYLQVFKENIYFI